jgi:hypothetical protein
MVDAVPLHRGYRRRPGLHRRDLRRHLCNGRHARPRQELPRGGRADQPARLVRHRPDDLRERGHGRLGIERGDDEPRYELYQNAWKTSADSDAVFRKAQRDYRSDHYWDPAFAQAQTDGLRALGDRALLRHVRQPWSRRGRIGRRLVRRHPFAGVTVPGGSGGGVGPPSATPRTATSASSASTANKTVVSKFTAGSGGTLDTGHARLWIELGLGVG